VDVIVVEISDGDSRGRAECVPMRRFGETIDSVRTALDAMKGAVSSGLARDTLQSALPPGAARNALDCAFWAIEANRSYVTVAALAGIGLVKPVETAFTLDFDTPDKMAAVAAAHRTRPLFRLELGGEDDMDRVRAVRQAAPAARLIVDANEGWNAQGLADIIPGLLDSRVELIEQPLPAGADNALAGLGCKIPLCADESCRTVADLDRIVGKYAAINIKLDKVGGLTPGLALERAARFHGMKVMLGCSGPTSLGAAPAYVLGSLCDYVDLDGPALLVDDRADPMRYDNGRLYCFSSRLWGG
ncbi:MAG: dipeptide epimerase, partial [Alphaproteobacteria bacterium]|nr:dipeptide epimerase [Alphaproteobacteria bacterium]